MAPGTLVSYPPQINKNPGADVTPARGQPVRHLAVLRGDGERAGARGVPVVRPLHGGVQARGLLHRHQGGPVRRQKRLQPQARRGPFRYPAAQPPPSPAPQPHRTHLTRVPLPNNSPERPATRLLPPVRTRRPYSHLHPHAGCAQASIDESLDRLQTDYIDLIQCIFDLGLISTIVHAFLSSP